MSDFAVPGSASRLDKVLHDLLRRAPELQAAAVVSFDGLPMASALPYGFDEDRVRALCAAYFGEASRALLARMRLQMIMSDVGWTLWAAIQARVSTIDYDFTGWAEERWRRAAMALDGPDFGTWLDDAGTG